jgi:competence protein ComEA
VDDNNLDDESDTISTLVEEKLQPDEAMQKLSLDGTAEDPLIYVHVCGAVVNPGVYQVPEKARIIECIEAAGGLTLEAADDYINQAGKAEDGQRIYIPTQAELKELSLDEYISGDNNNQTDETAEKKININTADEKELMSLPGIGQAKAKSIIEYRKMHGDFKDPADLMNIPGIKEGLFARIKDLVIVR